MQDPSFINKSPKTQSTLNLPPPRAPASPTTVQQLRAAEAESEGWRQRCDATEALLERHREREVALEQVGHLVAPT